MQKLNHYLLFIISFLLLSCKKENPNLPPVATIKIIDKIEFFELNGEYSTDPENDILTYKWTSVSDKIVITNSDKSIATFSIPILNSTEDFKIILTVNDGENKDTVSIFIEIEGNSYLRIWGLGSKVLSEKSNNLIYEWYLDQMNTGTYAGVNCGPASVTMAIKWFDQNFTKTPEDARNTYRAGGGWWYTNDIINYLNTYNVYNKTIKINSMNDLKNEISKGNIAILCLDMYYINYDSNPEHHIDKFYVTSSTGWGHFIVIKGFKEMSNQLFFEAYDPYSLNRKYTNNTYKGKDRYYKSADLDQATGIWWDYAIIVSKTSFKGEFLIDHKLIKHMPGR